MAMMVAGTEGTAILTMAGAGLVATPETVVIGGLMVRVEVEQAAGLTVLPMAIAAAAVWGLLGKVLQGLLLTMQAAAVLAEKHQPRCKTPIQATLMVALPPVVVMVEVVAVVALTLRALLLTEALMAAFVLFGALDVPSPQPVQEICKCITYYSTMSWMG